MCGRPVQTAADICVVLVEAASVALTERFHTGQCEAEHAGRSLRVGGRHDDGHCFRHHTLVAVLSVKVDGGQEARLRRVCVYPAQCEQLQLRLYGQQLHLVHCGAGGGGGLLCWYKAVGDSEAVVLQSTGQYGARLDVSVGVAGCVR